MPAVERPPVLKPPESLDSIMHRLPCAVDFAKLEMESSGMAKTPEGKFALTYLLAVRNLLRPVLTETHVHQDLLQTTGGPENHPDLKMDDIGTEVAYRIPADLPHFWLHTEQSADWQNFNKNNETPDTGKLFAVIDPVDMTSSISRGDRVQSTGIAIYTREGRLKTVGMVSLINNGFIFIENNGNSTRIYGSDTYEQPATEHDQDRPLRIAAKIRRMYQLQTLPLMKHGIWSLDCDSGFAVLGVYQGTVDTVIDHIKGNPWYEVAIWGGIAESLGYPMTDAEGQTVDLSAMMQNVIRRHRNDEYRIPFVISKNRSIHSRVLPLLRPA